MKTSFVWLCVLIFGSTAVGFRCAGQTAQTTGSLPAPTAYAIVNTAISAMNEIGTLTPVFINDDRAEYYFTDTIAGQTITFPIEFDKENGVWKIFEF